MKRKTQKTFKVLSLLRGWYYVAHVTNGKLDYIKAGCRKWRTFDGADAHYDGGGRYEPVKWLDSRFKTDRNDLIITARRMRTGDGATLATFDDLLNEYANNFANREEARAILKWLRARVESYQKKFRKRRRK